MDDPLNRAFAEATPRRKEMPQAEIAEHRTRHVRSLGTELESVRAQLLAMMASPFFDDGAQAEIIPVVKHSAAELGTVKVTARKREPGYEALASVEVQAGRDHAEAVDEAGRYLVRAKLAMTSVDRAGHTRRELVFAVHEIDGELRIDGADLKEKIAQAIREVGKP